MANKKTHRGLSRVRRALRALPALQPARRLLVWSPLRRPSWLWFTWTQKVETSRSFLVSQSMADQTKCKFWQIFPATETIFDETWAGELRLETNGLLKQQVNLKLKGTPKSWLHPQKPTTTAATHRHSSHPFSYHRRSSQLWDVGKHQETPNRAVNVTHP